MGLTDRKDAPSKPVRRIPMTIRLSQPLLVQLIDYLKGQRNPDRETAVGGLLFGAFSAGQLTLDHFRPFGVAAASLDLSSGIGRERLLNEALPGAKSDPELSGLKVAGWFVVRSEENRGLNAVDVEFHNRRFRRVSDVALILRLDDQANVRTDFYSKLPSAPFSQLKHRFGSLRFSLRDTITEGVEISMTSNAQRPAQPVVLARMPGVGYEPGTPRVSYTAGPVLVRTPKEGEGPLLVRAFRSLTEPQRLFIAAAGSFVLAAGLTFISSFSHTSGQTLLPDHMPPGPGFGMEIEPAGDSLLLTWNGDVAANYKADGVMLIDDAAQHREVRLEPDEIANGVLLYRPASNSVLFRLRLSDGRGKTLVDSLRRIDANRARQEVPAANAKHADTVPPQNIAPERPQRRTGRTRRSQPASNRPADVPKLRVMSAPALQKPARVIQATDEFPPSTPVPVEIASLAPAESIYLGRRAKLVSLPKVEATSSSEPPPDLDAKAIAPQFQPPAALPPPNFAPVPDVPRNAETEIRQHARKRGVTPYIVAQLQSKVMPNAKVLAYSVQSEVSLQLQIHISENGHVTDAHVVQHSTGVNAEIEAVSIAAVKQWTFQPAQSYGSEVDSDYMVFLHFSPAPRP